MDPLGGGAAGGGAPARGCRGAHGAGLAGARRRVIVDALYRMGQLRKKGDMEGARQQMMEVLAVERVPHYREIAEGQLEELDALP
nr:DUF2379 family protein [Hyalangium gracile]